MPQISFTDPGLASYLIGIRSPGEVATHPMKGGLCETLTLGEFLKYRYNKGEESNLFFWRDKTGNEIDCLIEHAGSELIPVEIKSGRTIAGDYVTHIGYWNSLSGQSAEKSFVVFGAEEQQIRKQGRVIGFRNLELVMEFL